VHLKVWELEQEIDRDAQRKMRNKKFFDFILGEYIFYIYHRIAYEKSIM